MSGGLKTLGGQHRIRQIRAEDVENLFVFVIQSGRDQRETLN